MAPAAVLHPAHQDHRRGMEQGGVPLPGGHGGYICVAVFAHGPEDGVIEFRDERLVLDGDKVPGLLVAGAGGQHSSPEDGVQRFPGNLLVLVFADAAAAFNGLHNIRHGVGILSQS